MGPHRTSCVTAGPLPQDGDPILHRALQISSWNSGQPEECYLRGPLCGEQGGSAEVRKDPGYVQGSIQRQCRSSAPMGWWHHGFENTHQTEVARGDQTCCQKRESLSGLECEVTAMCTRVFSAPQHNVKILSP